MPMNNLQEKIKKAKEAGYSDQEIAEFLNKRGENVTTTANPMLNPVTNPNYIDPTNTGGVAALPDYAANMVRGAGQQVKDIGSLLAKPVTDPRGTMNFVNSLSRRMNPVTGPFESIKQAPNDINMAKGLGSYYKEQYGGGEEILRKLINDPAGVLSDIAMVGTLAGGVSKGSANIASAAGRGETATKLSQAGTELLKGSEAIDPLSMSSKMLSKGVSTAPVTSVGYNTVLKNLIQPSSKGKRVQQTIKDVVDSSPKTLASNYVSEIDKLPYSLKGGIKQTQKMIDEGNDALNNVLIEGGEVAERRVPVGPIIDELKNTAESITESAGKNVTSSYQRQIDTLMNKAKFDINGGLTLSVKEANKLKQTTADFIKKAYEGGKGSKELGAGAAAMKDKADALRLAINEVAPEVAEINNRLSTAYEMRDLFANLKSSQPTGLLPTRMEGLLITPPVVAATMFGGPATGALSAALGIPAVRAVTNKSFALSLLRGSQEGRNLIKRLLETADLGTNTGRVTRGASVLNSSQGNVR